MRPLLALLLSIVATTAWAQPGATVSGTAHDQAGLAVPGAAITITTGEGAVLATAVSGSDGRWSVRGLPAASLRVTVQLSGFRAVTETIVSIAGQNVEVLTTLVVSGYTDEVTVTASMAERTLASVPSSVGVVSGTLLEQARGVNLSEVLKFVPGVMAGDVSGVDDLRISIRGAGIRAGFGSRGVVLMADGFPVTEPDGQTPHFDGQIDLANAERVEVVKGPSSALYGGAALGGVVNVVSRAPSRRPGGTLRAEGGSYAFGKGHAAGSTGLGPFIVSGTAAITHIDGFRDHNRLRNVAGNGRADWSSDTARMTVSLLATDASLDLPGTLNRAQFDQDPSQARPVFVANAWGRENRLFRVGARYERRLGNGQGVEVESHGQTRDLFHPIFVVIDQNASRYVGRGRYRLDRGVHRLVVGTDVDTQWVDDRWFVNSGGRPGFQIRDDDNLLTNLGVYAQDEIAIGARGNLTLGVRADRIRYRLDDRLSPDGAASDRRTFSRVSPKVGATARLTDTLVAYGNIAAGFEAPTLGEIRLPGGFNETVEPQSSRSVEGGLRGQSGRLSYDVAVYHMRIDDAILPETVNNVTLFRNVARASHTGLELSARVRPTTALAVDGAYAYSRFTLGDFGAFTGNRVPGTPAHAGSVRASYTGGRGWDAAVSLVTAGRAYVSDANTETAGAYAVVSATGGYRLGRARAFVRGENLGDVRYTNRVQVNDSGGFFYYPAPGRHASAGIEVRW
jgi:iron complex outermembrane receptor protein